MAEQLTETIEQLGKSFEEFKKAQDERVKALEQNQGTSEIDQKLERIENEMTELSSMKERLENLELQANRISAGGGKGDSQQSLEHKAAFLNWVRNPKDHRLLSELQQKAVEVGSNSSGGYALPEVISRQIEAELVTLSPMRQIAKVESVGTTDYKKLVNTRGTDYGWVGEGDSRSETDTSALQEVVPTFGTIYAFPKASEESLNDLFFDVEDWIRSEVSTAIAKGEGIAFIKGNGTKKPTGFLAGTPENTGDEDSPSRTFGELEYIKTGVSDGFGDLDTGSSPGHYPGDILLDTVYALKAGYRGNARWLCNKATLNTLRKFKDSEGNYLWQPGLQMGEPQRLLGYPVAEMEDMEDIGSDNFPVAFGDFRSGYLICDLVGMRMTVDDNITTPGYVKFYIRKRVGGKLMKDEAIKVIKCES